MSHWRRKESRKHLNSRAPVGKNMLKLSAGIQDTRYGNLPTVLGWE